MKPSETIDHYNENAVALNEAMEASHRGRDCADDDRHERDFLYSFALSLAATIGRDRWQLSIKDVQASQARIDTRVAEIIAERTAEFREHPCNNAMCQIVGFHAAPCEYAKVSQ